MFTINEGNFLVVNITFAHIPSKKTLSHTMIALIFHSEWLSPSKKSWTILCLKTMQIILTFIKQRHCECRNGCYVFCYPHDWLSVFCYNVLKSKHRKTSILYRAERQPNPAAACITCSRRFYRMCGRTLAGKHSVLQISTWCAVAWVGGALPPLLHCN